MRISQLDMNGFGKYADASFALEGSVTCFYGHNEAGKSTMLGFIRAILFGFPTRANMKERYEPLHGGMHGGAITLLDDRSVSYRVERYGSKPRVILEDGTIAGDELLQQLLNHMSPSTYKNLFAFGLSELQEMNTLQSEELNDYIFNAGIGGGAAHILQAEKRLIQEMEQLYKPRGRIQEIPKLMKEMEDTKEELAHAKQAMSSYNEYSERLTQTEESIVELHHELSDHAKQLEWLQQCAKAREQWLILKSLEEEWHALPHFDPFPEVALRRYEKLEAEQESILIEEQRLTHKLEELRQQPQVESQQEQMNRLMELRNRMERKQQVEAQHRHSQERFEDLQHSREALHSTHSSPIQKVWMSILLLFNIALPVYLYLEQSTAVAAISFGALFIINIMLWLSFMQKRKLERASSMQFDVKMKNILSKLEQEREELKLHQSMMDRMLNDLAMSETAATRVESLGMEDINQMINNQQYFESKRQQIEQTMAELKDDRVRAQIAKKNVQDKILALWTEANAQDEAEFLRHCHMYARANELRSQIRQAEMMLENGIHRDQWPRLEEVLQEHTVDQLQKKIDMFQVRSSELSEQMNALREQRGKYQNVLEQLKSGEDYARKLQHYEEQQTEYDRLLAQWATRALCLGLFKRAKELYEQDKQPEVMRKASDYFSMMTGHQFNRVTAPFGEQRIMVERANGQYVEAAYLSRGTAEQLYLSLRLALASEYKEKKINFPIVMDDVLVNFDTERLRNALQVIKEVSKQQQLILFSCHAHIVATLKEVIPEHQLIHLR